MKYSQIRDKRDTCVCGGLKTFKLPLACQLLAFLKN